MPGHPLFHLLFLPLSGRKLRRATRNDLRCDQIEEPVYGTGTPLVAGGALAPRHGINPIRHLCKRIEVFKGREESIDLPSRTLRMDAGDFRVILIHAKGHLFPSLDQ